VPIAATGCVIPFEPEFEEPTPNLSPFVVSASPPIGSVVPANQELRVLLADPNEGDILFARWIVNYPPFSANSRFSNEDRIPRSASGSQVRDRYTSFVPQCFRDLAQGIENHRVMLVISDRPFEGTSSAEFPFDAVSDDAHALRVTWTVAQLCE
jgi:hypothetical protein